MKVTKSLAIPIIFMLAFVAFSTLLVKHYFNIQTLRKAIELREEDKTEDIHFIINSMIKGEVKNLAALSKVLKENKELAAGLVHYHKSGGELEPLRKVMDRLYSTLDTDVFLVTNLQGIVVYRANDPGKRGDDQNIWGLDEALAGEDIVTSIRTPQGWAIQALAPVLADQKIQGVLFLRTRIDDRFAQKIAKATYTQISLGYPTGILASSFPPEQFRLIDMAMVERSILEKRSFFIIDDRNHRTFMYAPILVVDETFSLIVVVESPGIAALLKEKERQLILLSMVIFIVVIVLGSALTFYLISPLSKLQFRALAVIKEISGEDRSLEVQGNEIQTLSQAFDLMLLTLRNHINGLKQAEQARQESEEKYRLLVSQIPAMVFQGYGDWSIDPFDEKVEALTGYSKEDFESRRVKWCDLIPAEDLDYAAEVFIEALKTDKSYMREHRLRKKDGEIIWVQCRGQIFLNDQGKVDYISGVSFDVTARRQAEEALKESERFLADIFASIQDGINILDADYNILRVNPTAERWYAHALPLAGKKCYEAFLGRREPCEICPYRQTLETGKAAHKVSQRMGKDAVAAGWMEIFTFPITDMATGKVKGVVLYVRDITERKQSEEALHRSEAQLRQAVKMEAVGRLAGGVAHDFNNILTAITGYAELLLMNPDIQDPVSRDVKDILQAAERAASLTRQLLAFSRKQVLQPQRLDLNQVVANLDKMLRRIIGEDIDLVTVLGHELDAVQADPGQIEQVVMNLAANARDAMPQGGKLTIETADADLDVVYARSHLEVQSGPYVMLAVSDTGVGLDQESQARIFEPFFTTKELGKGTGLGLSMVYGIVKQSGGFIYVYSNPGEGTTFKIYLPRLEAAGDLAAGLGQVPDRCEWGSETILLVEDEDMVRQVASRILVRHGYTVLEAASGRDALVASREYAGPIHLMLTDVVMPGMSGWEAAENLKLQRPEMKVLFMSGYTENAIVHHGVLAPGVAFIQKPFRYNVLAQKIREMLDAPRDQ